jgi:hypothetical protein
MLAKVAFGLAIVIATASGSLASSHVKKSNGTSAEGIPAATTFVPSPPTIFGWPVQEPPQLHRHGYPY